MEARCRLTVVDEEEHVAELHPALLHERLQLGAPGEVRHEADAARRAAAALHAVRLRDNELVHVAVRQAQVAARRRERQRQLAADAAASASQQRNLQKPN